MQSVTMNGGVLFAILMLAMVMSQDICSRIAQISLEFGDLTGMSNQELKANARLELKCEVFGAPQASVTWLFNGNPVLTEDGAEFEQSLTNLDSTSLSMSMLVARLVVPCVSKRHAGSYTCKVENPCHEPMTKTAKVLVKEVAQPSTCPIGWHRQPATLTLTTESRLETAGAPIQVICRAVGYPLPSIDWSVAVKGTEQFVTIDELPAFKQLINGDLLIDSSQLTSEGETLRCTARNRFGSDSFDTSLILLANSK